MSDKIIAPNSREGFLNIYIYIYCVILLSSFSWWTITAREVASGGFAMASIVIRVIPMMVIFIILITKDAMGNWKGLKAMLTNAFYLVLVNYVVISAFSSLRLGQSYASVWKALELFIVIYFGAIIFSLKIDKDRTKEKILTAFIFVAIGIVLFNFLLAIINPDEGFRGNYLLQGNFPTLNPNGFGFLSLLTFVFVAVRKKTISSIFIFIALFIAFGLAQSRTAYFAFIFLIFLSLTGILVQIVVRGRLNFISVVALFFLLAIIGVLISLLISGTLFELILRGQDQDSLQELSGRSFVWKAASISISEAPWFGYGIGTESKLLPIKYPHIVPFSQDSGIGSTHSSVFESLLGAGFWGAGWYLLYFYLSGIRSILTLPLYKTKSSSSFIYKYALFAIIVMIFRSLTGATLAVLSFEWMLLILLFSVRSFPWQSKKITG